MAFQVSPGVSVNEVDLTTTIPATSVSTGAIVGTFNWGPVNSPTLVSSEIQLVSRFGEPDANTSKSFFTAANFLSYSNSLQVVRAGNTSSQFNASSNASAQVVIQNELDYFNPASGAYDNPSVFPNDVSYSARYTGAIGNSIEVLTFANTSPTAWSEATTNSASSLYSTWHQYADVFDYAPNTSPYVLNVTGQYLGDELHVLVIDKLGFITGTAGTILEKYQSLSKFKDAKATDGTSNYYREVLFRKSKYLYSINPPTDNPTSWGSLVSTSSSFSTAEFANTAIFAGGADGAITENDYVTALTNSFADKEKIDISLLMTGDGTSDFQNEAITVAQNRMDCVAFISPPLSVVQVTTDTGSEIVEWAQSVTPYDTTGLTLTSSYAVVDSGWKYQYDKYNDKYVWVPLNGDIAGLCARTDASADPWYSPAGVSRGAIQNIVKLAYNPNQADRDILYKAGINPVVSFPGEGTLLFGDKTFLNRPSAFDRINVRRLFIVLEKTIARAARGSLFEFNDSFTQSQFVNLVEPFLRSVQSRRGIYNYRVVCDSTNNTPDVIDANQFVGDIYIQPARSINYIQLNFIATRTGVDFTQIVGQLR